MKIKLQIRSTVFYSIIIASVVQIASCKKEAPASVTIFDQPPPPSPPSPPPTGTVNFWREDSAMVYYGYVYVSVNNETKTLSSWYEGAGPSACTSVATLAFYLPPGTYPWKAWKSTGTDTVSGTITIHSGCVLQQIIF